MLTLGMKPDRHIERRTREDTAGGFWGADQKSFGLQTGSMIFKSTIVSTTRVGAIN